MCPPPGVLSDRLTLGWFFRPDYDAPLVLSGAETHQPHQARYPVVTAAEFIALQRDKRLSTVVTPAGQLIRTPLSARFA